MHQDVLPCKTKHWSSFMLTGLEQCRNWESWNNTSLYASQLALRNPRTRWVEPTCNFLCLPQPILH
jgi:hypothetical protein